jgi:hypothetical protein
MKLPLTTRTRLLRQKDGKVMDCCQSQEGKEASCCHEDAVPAMDCCKGHDAATHAAQNGKATCDTCDAKAGKLCCGKDAIACNTKHQKGCCAGMGSECPALGTTNGR